MDKILVKNLQFWGIHGNDADEKSLVQPFGIEVSMECDFTKAIKTDSITKTVDYKEVEKIIKNIIEGQHVNLIETLADKICLQILEKTRASLVEITLTKIKAKTFGVPSVTISRIKNK